MYYRCVCPGCSLLIESETQPKLQLCDACADADCDLGGKSPCKVKLGSARETVTISTLPETPLVETGDVATALGHAAKVCENTMKVWVDEVAEMDAAIKSRVWWRRALRWLRALLPLVLIFTALGCEGDPLNPPQDAPTAAELCPEGQAPAPAWGGTCQKVSPSWWPLIGPMRTDCPFGWGPMPVTTDPARPFWTCECEQGCGPCPDGWHKAGEWGATCERDSQ